MEQLTLGAEKTEGVLPKWECAWKPHSTKYSRDTCPEIRLLKGFSEYSPDAYSLCERCDGTEECGKELECENFLKIKYEE